MLNKMTIASSVKLSILAVAVYCCLAGAAQAAAQAQKTAAAGSSVADRFQVELGFNAAYADLAGTSNTFWLTGGNAEVAGRIYKTLGFAVDVQGMQTSNTGGGVPLNLLTFTAGPRLSWSSHSPHKFTIFEEGLVGAAYGYNSTFPALPSASASAHSLAVQLDAGADVALSRYFSIRLAQGGWLRTALPNSSTNSAQNDFQIGAGIVLHTSH